MFGFRERSRQTVVVNPHICHRFRYAANSGCHPVFNGSDHLSDQKEEVTQQVGRTDVNFIGVDDNLSIAYPGKGKQCERNSAYFVALCHTVASVISFHNFVD